MSFSISEKVIATNTREPPVTPLVYAVAGVDSSGTEEFVRMVELWERL